ncbi:MAG: FKBP-type peptidyl-prolyl cis-trans isomerase [Bacteroidales bacterium]
MKRSIGIILAATTLLFTNCESGDPYVKESIAIGDYKTAHNITAEPLASGLYYIETRTGTGATPAYGAKVRVKYTGTFTDGTVFDSGTYDFLLGLGRVIKGWDEGISYMKEGGKAILIVPSDLAYGPNGYSDIPGYTPLVFDVELIDIL